MRKVIILFVLLLSTLSVRPLFTEGFFHVHDDTQVVRVYEMGKALRDGYFPVRWVKDLGYGYGYPLFNFYAPLSYYTGGLFYFFGFNALFATKLTIILGIYLSGVCMYFAAKEIWGEIGGIVSALFYVYAPFHAVDIYVRGDVAEFFAYSLIPLLLYGLWNYYKTQKYRYVVVTIVGYAFIILSHNLTAFMITPFFGISLLILIFYFVKKRKIKSVVDIISIPIIALLLSSWYFVPALLEMNYTNIASQIGGGADYKEHFVCISQLWNSMWGYGGSTKECIDGLSFKIGKLHLILLGLSFLGVWRFRKKNELLVLICIVFLFLITSIFLTLPESRFIWDRIPLMEFLQYPWRFLVLISFFTSFLIGSLFSLPYVSVKKYVLNGIFSAFVVIVILLYQSTKMFVPQYIFPATDAFYTNDYHIKWVASKISDEYLPPDFKKPSNYNEVPKNILSSDGFKNVEIEINKTHAFKARAVTEKSVTMPIQLAYFPFWTVKVNGETQKYKVMNGKILISVPKGDVSIATSIVQTPLERWSNVLSLTGVVVLLLGIISSRRKIHSLSAQ